MLLLANAIVFDLLLAWMICRMVLQSRSYRMLGPHIAVARSWPRIAVIVPARNEERLIGRCVEGLLAQSYPSDRLSITLVDDASADRTAAIARECASGEERFRVVRGDALPDGWTGKCFACWQGATVCPDADYLCFMDADTRAEPELLASVVAFAERSGSDMVSLQPYQELGSIPERLVIPCGFYLIAASQDMRRVRKRTRPATACGQFILIRSSVYRSIGGHASLRREICEDAALARAVEQAGYRFSLQGGERLIRTRMYDGWRSLWTGLSKNAIDIARSRAEAVLVAGAGVVMVAAAGLLTGWVVESVYSAPSPLTGLGAVLVFCGVAALVGLHVAGARHFRIPFIYGLLFPAGYVLSFLLVVNSARLAWIGRVEWKGRTYPRPADVTRSAGQPAARS